MTLRANDSGCRRTIESPPSHDLLSIFNLPLLPNPDWCCAGKNPTALSDLIALSPMLASPPDKLLANGGHHQLLAPSSLLQHLQHMWSCHLRYRSYHQHLVDVQKQLFYQQRMRADASSTLGSSVRNVGGTRRMSEGADGAGHTRMNNHRLLYASSPIVARTHPVPPPFNYVRRQYAAFLAADPRLADSTSSNLHSIFPLTTLNFRQDLKFPPGDEKSLKLPEPVARFDVTHAAAGFGENKIPSDSVVDHRVASTLTKTGASSEKNPAIKSHRCVYCGKMYSRKYGLKIHIRTHTGYKPLKCKVCGRPFGDPSNLNKHVRLHAKGHTPYKCEHCGKVLVRRRDLERHVKSRHTHDRYIRQGKPSCPAFARGSPPAADPKLWAAENIVD